MKKGNKNISSIFDNCHETASQEIFLRRCGFALQDDPPDSDPSVGVSPPLNDGVASHRASDDSETDSVIASGYEDDDVAVENQAIRFVSPQQSADTVDLEEDATDRTVPVESEVDLLSNRTSSSSGNRGGKKVKVPLRDVVKAIVTNSMNTEEEDKEIEKKMSCVQILVEKGFNFPTRTQNPSGL